MRLLQELKIGSTVYQVFEATEEDCPDLVDSEGLTQSWLGRILIHRDCPNHRRESILFHEVLHAVCSEADLPLDSKVEERVVVAFTAILLPALVDNGWRPPKSKLNKRGEKNRSSG